MKTRNWFFKMCLLVVAITLVFVTSGIAKTTLRFWCHSDPGFVAADEALVDAFERENPDIDIVYEAFPYDDYFPKLQTTVAAGTVADILTIWGEWAPIYAKAGGLLKVPDSVMTKAEIEKNYYPPTLASYCLKGEYYGLPEEFNLEYGGAIINKELFRKAGITDTEFATWDELISTAEKLTITDEAGTIIQSGFEFLGLDCATYGFLSFILELGGDYRAKDGIHVRFNTPEGIEAMNFVVDLAKFATGKDPDEAFFAGEAAMEWRGTWIIGSVKVDFPDMDVDYVALPPLNGSRKFPAETGWGLVVTSACKNPGAAWKFVRFALARKENAQLWNTTTYTVPALKALWMDPELLKKQPWLKVPFTVLSYGQHIGPVGNRDQFFTNILVTTQKILLEGMSVKKAVIELEKEQNSLLDEYY